MPMCRGTAREWKCDCSLLGSNASSGLGLTAVGRQTANKAQHLYNTPGNLEWEAWETTCLMGRDGEKIAKITKMTKEIF